MPEDGLIDRLHGSIKASGGQGLDLRALRTQGRRGSSTCPAIRDISDSSGLVPMASADGITD
jgi:hypothetical protein